MSSGSVTGGRVAGLDRTAPCRRAPSTIACDEGQARGRRRRLAAGARGVAAGEPFEGVVRPARGGRPGPSSCTSIATPAGVGRGRDGHRRAGGRVAAGRCSAGWSPPGAAAGRRRGPSTGSSGRSSCHRWSGADDAGVADRLDHQPGQVDLGRAASGRPESSRASSSRSSTSADIRVGLGLDLRQRGRRVPRVVRAYDGTARRSPWIVASGVRSSCEASATNWRTCCSLWCRAVEGVSTWPSIVLSAAPTWPTSVRSSVRCSGTRSVDADLPGLRRQLGDGVRGGRDLVQRPQLASYDEACPRRRRGDTEQTRARTSHQIRLARVSSTLVRRQAGDDRAAVHVLGDHAVVAQLGEVDAVHVPVRRHVGELTGHLARDRACWVARWSPDSVPTTKACGEPESGKRPITVCTVGPRLGGGPCGRRRQQDLGHGRGSRAPAGRAGR